MSGVGFPSDHNVLRHPAITRIMEDELPTPFLRAASSAADRVDDRVEDRAAEPVAPQPITAMRASAYARPAVLALPQPQIGPAPDTIFPGSVVGYHLNSYVVQPVGQSASSLRLDQVAVLWPHQVAAFCNEADIKAKVQHLINLAALFRPELGHDVFNMMLGNIAVLQKNPEPIAKMSMLALPPLLNRVAGDAQKTFQVRGAIEAAVAGIAPAALMSAVFPRMMGLAEPHAQHAMLQAILGGIARGLPGRTQWDALANIWPRDASIEMHRDLRHVLLNGAAHDGLNIAPRFISEMPDHLVGELLPAWRDRLAVIPRYNAAQHCAVLVVHASLLVRAGNQVDAVLGPNARQLFRQDVQSMMRGVEHVLVQGPPPLGMHENPDLLSYSMEMIALSVPPAALPRFCADLCRSSFELGKADPTLGATTALSLAKVLPPKDPGAALDLFLQITQIEDPAIRQQIDALTTPYLPDVLHPVAIA